MIVFAGERPPCSTVCCHSTSGSRTTGRAGTDRCWKRAPQGTQVAAGYRVCPSKRGQGFPPDPERISF